VTCSFKISEATKLTSPAFKKNATVELYTCNSATPALSFDGKNLAETISESTGATATEFVKQSRYSNMNTDETSGDKLNRRWNGLIQMVVSVYLKKEKERHAKPSHQKNEV
jgi:hypothetical protein